MNVCSGDSPLTVAVKFCDDHNLELHHSAALFEAIQKRQLQIQQEERLQQQRELLLEQQQHQQVMQD
jgi:hypothetical protein